MPDKVVDIDIGEIFIGYGLFLLMVLLAVIAPELTHQHLNYDTFTYDVRVISRYGFLSIAFGLLLKKVLGGLIINE